MKLLFTILIISIVGFSLIPFIQNPDDILLKIMLIVTSIGLPGIFTFACFTSIRYFPSEHRGTLNGIVGIFAVCGAAIVMILGGYLFDRWNRSGPFILYDCLLIMSTIWLFIIYATKIKNTKFDEMDDKTSALKANMDQEI